MFDTETEATLDSLEFELLAYERTIARCRAQQLDLIRRLDAAQVATADGCRTMAEWVAARLDLDSAHALDLVRTARATEADDQLAGLLADGNTSYDRVSATARLRESGTHPHTVHASLGWNLAAVRRAAAAHREHTIHDEVAAHEARHLVMQPSLDESAWRLRGLLPGLDGRIVSRALLEGADALPVDPDLPRESRAARTADALTSLCLGAAHTDRGGATDEKGPMVTLHVDAHRLAETRGRAGAVVEEGPRVGRNVLEQALCEGSVELHATELAGEALSLGRTTRVVRPRLRRYVLGRDGGCTAAGCTSVHRLQAHHIVPWSEGGRTDVDNLTTLCWFHHHVVVHGRGFSIDPESPPGMRRFVRKETRDPP